jgi:glycerophosphoryl diester phosphodiesterase
MVLVIGHRGAKGYEPENTLRSFKKALELKVDMIELDVQLSKDKQLIVIHDNKVNRTTNGSGYVKEKTFNELRSLDAGKGEKIPTLREVFNLVDKQVTINIELKGKGTAKPVARLIEMYVKKKGWTNNHSFVSSFDYEELEKFNELNPEIKLGVLIGRNLERGLNFAEKIKAKVVSPRKRLITKKLIDKIHKKGRKVYVWTVNTKKGIEKIKKLKVDGIFSNYPDRI